MAVQQVGNGLIRVHDDVRSPIDEPFQEVGFHLVALFMSDEPPGDIANRFEVDLAGFECVEAGVQQCGTCVGGHNEAGVGEASYGRHDPNLSDRQSDLTNVPAARSLTTPGKANTRLCMATYTPGFSNRTASRASVRFCNASVSRSS